MLEPDYQNQENQAFGQPANDRPKSQPHCGYQQEHCELARLTNIAETT